MITCNCIPCIWKCNSRPNRKFKNCKVTWFILTSETDCWLLINVPNKGCKWLMCEILQPQAAPDPGVLLSHRRLLRSLGDAALVTALRNHCQTQTSHWAKSCQDTLHLCLQSLPFLCPQISLTGRGSGRAAAWRISVRPPHTEDLPNAPAEVRIHWY